MKSLFLTAVATLGLTAATLAQVPSYVPTNGLVGWWPFNGNANDESGNGNNGTVNGATLTADRFGNANKAYSFDGVDDNLGLGNFFNFYNFSISIWTNPGIQNGHAVIIDNYHSSSNNWVFQAISNFQNNGYNFLNSNEILLSTEQWNHILLMSDANTIKVYLNSNLVSVTQFSINYNNPPSLFLGFWQQANARFWKGKLDDIGIWNRALTQQEIIALYNGCQLAVNTQPTSQLINMNNTASFVVGSSDPNASYQWQTDLGVGFQNLTGVGQYIGATTNTLTVSNVTMSNNNQPFRCIVSSGTCADTSDVAVLTVNNNASIEALSNDKLVTVYPNPAQNQLHVKTGIELMNASYSIIDNTGRTVLTGQLTSESTVIELSGLSIGTYFLNVGDQLKESFKVLKNQ